MAKAKLLKLADPIHGSIELGPVQQEIIETQAFQRLRNVKQLGLAHLVYPAADYSRFSHSVGASHLAGQIIRQLVDSEHIGLTPRECDFLKVAAMLHDVGHYPFSHAMEDAIKDYYEPMEVASFDHEDLGRELVLHDVGLKEVLERAEIKPSVLWNMASGKTPRDGTQPLVNLVSADLDVDRMDYLQRTARHTALPYGNFDVRYLISQTRVDEHKRLALTHNAVGTVEHLLMGRYYDYLNVSFHKTVQGLEWLLKESIKELLNQESLKLDADTVTKMIASPTEKLNWQNFDDFFVFEKIKKLASARKVTGFTVKANYLLRRQPPAMVAEFGLFSPREEKGDFIKLKEALAEKVPAWSEKFGVSQDYWHIWSPRKLSITKNAPPLAVPGGSESEALAQEKAATDEVAPRIMNPTGSGSHPIFEHSSSIMGTVSKFEHFLVRVYVCLTDEQRRDRVDSKIRAELLKDFPERSWNYG